MTASITSLQDLISLNQQIERGTHRDAVVAKYEELSKTAQFLIKQCMEICSHERICIILAEQLILFPNYCTWDPIQIRDQNIHEKDRIFHIALKALIAFYQEKQSLAALHNLREKIQNKHSNKEIIASYEELPSTVKGMLAGGMHTFCKDSDIPRNTVYCLARVAAVFKKMDPKSFELAYSSSPLRFAVEELLAFYPPEEPKT